MSERQTFWGAVQSTLGSTIAASIILVPVGFLLNAMTGGDFFAALFSTEPTALQLFVAAFLGGSFSR